MTGQEARDEIAQIVKTVNTKWGGPAMRAFENDPPIRKHFAIADALIAAGYSKHPEPEHGPDWSDWGIDHPDEPPSCRCGYNGTPEECAAAREHPLVAEVRNGDFEDRAWMIDVIERLSGELTRNRPGREFTDAHVGAMEQAAHRALSCLAKRGDWHEDDTAIGGQAAYIVWVILEAATPRVPVGEGKQ